MILSMLLSFVWAQSLETTDLMIGEYRITVEVADEIHERQMGLMHRESLAVDSGMLFVYTEMKPRSFWMKNTLIPLSIAYLNSECQILHIADMTPLSLDSVPSVYPAQYALEMNQGWFAKHDISVGMTITGDVQCQSKSNL